MPGKQGGFFKRLKAKQQKESKRKQRGTMGMRRTDRIKKHNALVDIYAAQRKLRELDEISQSSDDGASVGSDDAESTDSDVPPQAKSLLALRSMLGVKPGVAPNASGVNDDSDDDDDESDDPSVVSASDLADSDADDVDEEEDGEDPIQTCALCATDLTDAVGAVACPECRQCYCADCHEGTHEAMGHDVVPLDDIDAEVEDDEEDEEEEEDFDDDAADDLFGAINDDGTVDQAKLAATRAAKQKAAKKPTTNAPTTKKNRAEEMSDGAGADEEDYDDEEEEEDEDGDDVAAAFDAEANEPGTAEHAERQRAFLPAFDYGRMTDNREAHAAVAKSVDAADPWLATYINDTPLQAAPSKKKENKQSRGGNVDADAVTDAADVPAFAALASSDELGGASHGAVALHVTQRVADWAREHLKPSPSPSQRPPFVLPFVWDKWVAYKRREGADQPLTPSAVAKLQLLSTYADGTVNTRTWGNEAGWMDAVALHMLNHWAKTVAAMAANDEVLKARKAARRAAKEASAAADGEEEGAAAAAAAAASPGSKKKRLSKRGRNSAKNNAGDDDDEDEEELELRDRGFAKTRLLLVVPMRHQALQYLSILHGVLGTRDKTGRERFEMFTRDFSEIDEVVDPKFKKRQEDYRKQFAGNINDTFCVGASLRASGMSVYTHVLNSDILVCSPLGLRRRVAKDADVLVSLSSIEVAIVDQASTLLMQNWEHVAEMMKLVNKMPSDTTEGLSDLRRVFPWALEGKAAAHRQTVAISAIAHATINGFIRAKCDHGTRGVARVNPDQLPGVLPVITHGVRQHFMRFPCDDLSRLDDARLEYFKKVVYPSQVKPLVDRNVHAILLVPSTFDFFKVRVFLDEQLRGSFAELTEHTSTKKQRKALGQFSSLERPLLVMTERFYFFKRYFVKHAEALVCYSPPLFPHFYAAFVNNLAHESTNATVVCPFTRYDALELQRILGAARANAVLTRPADSFLFASTSSKNLL